MCVFQSQSPNLSLPTLPSWVFIGRTDVEAEISILWLPDEKSWLIRKDPDAGKDCRREEKGTTEDEMAGWHHRLDGHGFGWTLGVGNGQGGLACCGSRGHRVGHDWATELNWPFPPSNHKSFYICDYFCFASQFICATFLDSTCKQYHMIFVFLWLTSLSMTVSSGRCIL